MFPIVIGLVSVLAAWRWGDWRNWRHYLPTIQYFIGGDMLYNLLCERYLLWDYPHPPNLLPNHLVTNLFIMFVIYPSTMLIYLYRYPYGKSVLKQVLYILMWIVAWMAYELYMITHGLCVYHHGWTYAWSIGFACVMVSMLRLHHTRPLAAYILSIPITLFLLVWFHVPVLQGVK
ncbi:CBO0543 family protein [Alicyclobacillus ferrooxydans]|uniref:Uncharacterized protein n=1 Tax=Alicyclobacillus ferrooxydans TaxID=471514 RepID=A0A0P9CYH7_9BACL|nr:CBO0543 family protein [Alicyclobacillus ferrooxydans]KPV41959.1 hypothetical protein AN477_19470 [Alicyclobacillus ferrooxydans]